MDPIQYIDQHQETLIKSYHDCILWLSQAGRKKERLVIF